VVLVESGHASRCATCRAELAPGARFCSSCGTAVAASVDPARDAGERRQLTVLFCDLVGSTEMAGRLDPEDWGQALADYHRRATEIVAGVGGHVAQYLGDGVLAYFGWPQAREDAAERAVRAGLALVAAELQAGDESMRVRVGIHTGPVVVGAAGGGREMLALGGAPNVAARVQAMAKPGTVLLTDATLRLVQGAFHVEDAGTHELKGVRDPVTLHRALTPSGARSRAFTASGSRLTPFVGRRDELDLIVDRWARARDGAGQVVIVTGEAGIGKSRLVRRLREEIGCAPETWIELATSAYHENTPFFAVAEGLRGIAGARDASDAERLQALGTALARGGLAPDEALPLVAPLLGLSAPEHSSAPASPDERHRLLLASLAAWVAGLARLAPVVVVVEDLHWADPSTLELLQVVAERAASTSALLVLTARPEFHPPWAAAAHHTTIALGRLTRADARSMVERATTGLSRDVVDVLVDRTDGVPLFVEELTRLVVESGEEADAQAIPSTLSDSLMARLDRLGPAKEVAQVGAVVGRDFGYDLVRAVLAISEDDLRDRLERLRDSDLVQAQGAPPDATYRFKHALVQDAAYGSLLRRRRRELHRAVAELLGRDATTPPEILARHHGESGDHDAAAAAWQQAGDQTAARGALGAAAAHYDAALTSLLLLPDGPDRGARELPMRVALGQALFMRRGYGSPEVAAEFTRARVLAAETGNPFQMLPVLLGLFVFAHNRHDDTAMWSLADEMTAAAETIGHPAALVWAYWAQGATRYSTGELVGAERWLAKAIDAYDIEHHRGRPTDPGMSSLEYAAMTAWHLGRPDTAREHMRNAEALAERLQKTYSIVLAKAFACVLHIGLRDVETVGRLAREMETPARDNRLAPLELTGIIYGGWAAAVGGGGTLDLDRMRDAVVRYAKLGQRQFLGLYRGLLAEAEAAAGELDAALATVRHALADDPERIHRPALLCVEGDVLARLGCADDETICGRYRDALAAATSMGARSDELSAALRLARRLVERGRSQEACALLAPLDAALVEGREMPDACEMSRLLAGS
jgi:class 3 adenylate cyclase